MGPFLFRRNSFCILWVSVLRLFCEQKSEEGSEYYLVVSIGLYVVIVGILWFLIELRVL